MHRIHYAGSQFVTTDEVALEFVGFAVDLAKRGSAVAVEVPIVTDGDVHLVTFVIGPASQIAAEPASEMAEVDMGEALQRLRTDRADEGRSRSFAVYDESSGTFVDEF
jgi:hypothetical protein